MRIRVFATAIAAVCVLSICFADVASAQPGGRGGFGGRGFFGGNDGWMGLLRNESVMNEIELVDDQKEEIAAIQDELREEMRERMMEMRDVPREERREMFTEMREEMEERQVEIQKEIEKVLMPMQIKRLKELEVQRAAGRDGGGTMGVLNNADVLEELGVSDKQRKKLEEKAAELKKKLEEKIKKLRADAEEELLSVLSSEQRKKLRDKVGKTFDFGDEFNRRGGRGGGRDRGDRGRRGEERDDF